MPKLHIEEVYPKGHNMIVNFQNGYATDEFKSKNCLLLQDKSTNEISIATEVCGLVYSGKVVEETLGKTVILARNKITGKVRLIEVDNVELKPVIISNNDQSVIAFDTSRLELSRKFGSKKQKQQMEQQEKLKVNVQTVTEQMHNVTVNISEEQLDLSSYIKPDSDDFYIPPINREAKTPNEVYDIYKIFSKEEFDQIFKEINENDYMQNMHPFIKEIVSSKTLSNEYIVLAVYASILLQLFSMMTKDIVKKNFVACSVSSTLNMTVLKNFTTFSNGKRNRSMQYKDKTFCYVLVILLLINNFKCDIEELSRHLKYSSKTMITKFRIIGATIVTSGDKKIAQLKIPLATVANPRRKSAKF